VCFKDIPTFPIKLTSMMKWELSSFTDIKTVDSLLDTFCSSLKLSALLRCSVSKDRKKVLMKYDCNQAVYKEPESISDGSINVELFTWVA